VGFIDVTIIFVIFRILLQNGNLEKKMKNYVLMNSDANSEFERLKISALGLA
jgi:hypothetical protein